MVSVGESASALGVPPGDELRPERMPQLRGSPADDQRGTSAVDEDARGDAEHALAQPHEAPSIAGGRLGEHPRGVRHVVGEGVEQEDYLVLGEGVAGRGALLRDLAAVVALLARIRPADRT